MVAQLPLEAPFSLFTPLPAATTDSGIPQLLLYSDNEAASLSAASGQKAGVPRATRGNFNKEATSYTLDELVQNYHSHLHLGF